MLICTLSIRDSSKAFFWTSRFERDASEKITGFTDQLQCQPMEASGRFMEVWRLDPDQAYVHAVFSPSL
jgi:hypothetical protein